MKVPKTLLSVIGVILLAAGGIYWWWREAAIPGRYDDFARCLGQRGLTFYGAYWCPHCAAQKKRFGKSAKLLPYIECAVPGTSELTAECRSKNIQSFPTWIGPGEKRSEGELELSELERRSGCALPQ